MSSILEFRNLTKYVGGAQTVEQWRKRIVEDISFSVEPNEVFTILGPSGAGKTTLLRMINGLEPYESGEILYRGKNISEIPVPELRREIGMVFQSPIVLPGSVMDNLDFAVKHSGKRFSSVDYSRLMKAVNLPEVYLDKASNRLSNGEKQRLAIARALISDPAILLLDEPTSALDPSAAKKILNLLAEVRKERSITYIFVTHLMEHAQLISDKVMLLMPDEEPSVHKTAEFFSSSASQKIRQFIEGDLE